MAPCRNHTCAHTSHIKSEMATSLQNQGHRRKEISLSCSRERGKIHSPVLGLCSGSFLAFLYLVFPLLHTQHTENGGALTTGTSLPPGYASCTTPWKKGWRAIYRHYHILSYQGRDVRSYHSFHFKSLFKNCITKAKL